MAEQPHGVQCLRGVIDERRCSLWRAAADAALQRQRAAAGALPGGSSAPPGPGNVRLNTLPDLLDEVSATLQQQPEVRRALHLALGAQALLLIDHCWIRHQCAPGRRGSGHWPHSWHQDGALAFDFLATPAPDPAQALLPLLTCWLPLVPCGADAPSLAWFEPPLDHLLPPAALHDDAIGAEMARRGSTSPPGHALLAAGDALLFGGGVVHHTHATASMRRDRTSLELRWLPAAALPARLAGTRTALVDLTPHGRPGPGA